MTTIYLLRHGQADSLGKNYDNLTELGHLQAKRVGEYFLRMKINFDYMASGNLDRQKQTLNGIQSIMNSHTNKFINTNVQPELNEFDGNMWKKIAQKIAINDPEFNDILQTYKNLQEDGDPKCKNLFLIIIQKILREWVGGGHVDVYPFENYHNTVLSILKSIPPKTNNALLISSATPVAILSGYSLQLPQEKYIHLMKVISNSSLSIFEWDSNILSPITINSYPHIQDPEEISLL